VNYANVMRINSQSQVGLATVICLLCQGYIFTYIINVEPNPLISLAPIFLFVAYIYARNRRVWGYHKPIYWVVAIVGLTLADLVPYVWASNVLR
jgi:hypothetical protein